MTRFTPAFVATVLLTGCAPEVPPSWQLGNCIADTPAATRLALLRARVDSSPLFLRGATEMTALQREIAIKASPLGQDTVELRSGEPPLGATQLSNSWWRAVRSVHPGLEYVDSSTARVFAIGRMALDSTHTAYLLRVPGVEVEYRDELWIADDVRRCFLIPQLVALAWGDGGETSELESWLVDLDGDGVRELVQRDLSSVTTESPTDTTASTETTDSIFVLRWTPPHFARDSVFDVSRLQWTRLRTP